MISDAIVTYSGSRPGLNAPDFPLAARAFAEQLKQPGELVQEAGAGEVAQCGERR